MRVELARPGQTVQISLGAAGGAGLQLRLDQPGATLAAPVGGGLICLTTGTVGTPVAFLDFVLPTGYAAYRLSVRGLDFSASDSPCAVLSADGSATFWNDNDASDTYRSLVLQASEAFESLAPPQLNRLTNAVALLTAAVGTGYDLDLQLSPGSASVAPRIDVQSSYDQAGIITFDRAVATLNAGAAQGVTLARATTLRLGPYGNGDLGAPTSATRLTAGGYALWGLSV
jgi:hypothetical protein